ncbi:metallophosphoesterase [Endothiovibrio diazotrophicus]
MEQPRFDALYAISDLHLGGEEGFQIFTEGKRLAKTIERICHDFPERETALVLNGDVVDFLAEAPACYLDTTGALKKLRRIYLDEPKFRPVWSALEQFVATEKRHLIFVLGNHDVELALPEVQEWLAARLSQNSAAARGRLRFHTHGSGFSCMVGDRRVLCLHGNEIDDWNVVDFHSLSKILRSLNRGVHPPEWDANAGTRLVVDVMNKVKARYPMVDLLKPETKAVVPILTTLDLPRDVVLALGHILRVMGALGWDAARRRMGFLATERELEANPQDPHPNEYQSVNRLLDDIMQREAGGKSGEDALLAAFRALEQDDNDPLALAEWSETRQLGAFDWVRDLFRQQTRKEVMRKGLRIWLKENLLDDFSFDTRVADDNDKALMELAGPDVHFLIAGHSHLRRALPRSVRGAYYNTGTWAQLIRIPPEVLDDQDAFDRLYQDLQAPNLSALGAARLPNAKPLLIIQPTVACIEPTPDGMTRGKLCNAEPDGQRQTLRGTES